MDPAPERSVAGPSPDRVAVAAALRRIPEAQRVAIVLHYFCDLSLAQIAVETGVPIGTVKARLSRARASLALSLAERPMEETSHA